MQTDSYVGLMNNLDLIRADGYSIGTQKNHRSSTGTNNIMGCIKCDLPVNNSFYVSIVLCVLFLIFIMILLIILLYYRSQK